MPLCCQRRRIVLALGAGLFVGPAFASAQGFGIVKKNVTLVRSLPPVIDLADARVSVQVSGAGASARIDALVKAKLGAVVLSNRVLTYMRPRASSSTMPLGPPPLTVMYLALAARGSKVSVSSSAVLKTPMRLEP